MLSTAVVEMPRKGTRRINARPPSRTMISDVSDEANITEPLAKTLKDPTDGDDFVRLSAAFGSATFERIHRSSLSKR
jgi:hypothetical protein